MSSVEQLPLGAPPPALQMKGHCAMVSAVKPQLDRTTRPVLGSMIAGVSLPEDTTIVHVGPVDEDTAELVKIELAGVELADVETADTEALEDKLAEVETAEVLLGMSKLIALELVEVELAKAELVVEEMLAGVLFTADARLINTAKASASVDCLACPYAVDRTADEDANSTRATKRDAEVD